MSQPEWQEVGRVGDVDLVTHGGGIIYRDATGVYPPELERCEPLEDGTVEIRRVSLERFKMHDGKMVPYAYQDSWPHAVHSYVPWFRDSLFSVGQCMGSSCEELTEALCSDDPQALASAYEAIGDYHGWDNLDSYPLILSQSEAEKRYA